MGKSYVLGFRINAENEVLLIEKKRPPWQAGRFNGIGGKIEAGETPVDAMVREFREECGLDTAADEWRHVARMTGPHSHDPDRWVVDVFGSRGSLAGHRSCTPEIVKPYAVDYLAKTAIFNLKWLIPLCMDNEIETPILIPYKGTTSEG